MGAEDEIQDQKGIRGEFGRRPGHVRIIYKPFGEKVAENRVSEIVREAKTARRTVSATNTLVLGLGTACPKTGVFAPLSAAFVELGRKTGDIDKGWRQTL